MAIKLPDYLRKIEKASTKEGWTWDYRGSKHVMVFTPEGVAVTNVSLTQYDGVLRKKTLSQLRKHGCPGVQ